MTVRHYSTRDFFRRMPNVLLARYFKERGLLGNLNFTDMKENKPDKLFTAWLTLPDASRNEMDAEFREIFDLCCEKGCLAILDEAQWQLCDDEKTLKIFVEKLSMLPNHFERAMTTFLDHKDFWKGATRFYYADTLSYWRKRKNLPRIQAAVDKKSIQQLASLMRDYFHNTEGRGKNCIVEPYRRGERDYFFCYPEDHSQHSMEWVDGKFDQRPHNPAFEVVYVYSQKEGSLDLSFRNTRKAVESLQGIFAKAILKLDNLPPDPKDERVYELDPLRNKNFSFIYSIGSGIEKVAVRKLRFSSRINSGDRIAVEADPNHEQDAVYNLLDKIGKSFPLNLYSVTQAELVASVQVNPDKPAKQVTIRITYPNSCSLKYDEIDLKLRAMLEASGIELTEPINLNMPEALSTV